MIEWSKEAIKNAKEMVEDCLVWTPNEDVMVSISEDDMRAALDAAVKSQGLSTNIAAIIEKETAVARNEALEEAAKVVDEFGGHTARKAAERIRAMKNV